jgi:asparagine synthase (glutamine-hydrolysing)
MCGICGIIDRRLPGQDILTVSVMQLSNRLRHRGPDDKGIWVDVASGVGLGHCRLSIRDLSPAGNQPMVSSTGRYIIVFNGEVYNSETIKAKLEGTHGPLVWRGTSDTEVILEAIAAWGLKKATQLFNGMFALAVWDRVTQTISFVRDRFGVKPLYLARGSAGEILFASELKAIAKSDSFSGRLDHRALAEFLDLGYIPAACPIYLDSAVIPPGAIVNLKLEAKLDWQSLKTFTRERSGMGAGGSGWNAEFYWNAEEALAQGREFPFHGSREHAEQEVEELLRDAVQMRMVSDVPLGAFLSGGVDSSLVTALMRRVTSASVKTFAIAFPGTEFDESAYAREVARLLETEHHEFSVGEQDCLNVARQLADLQDEPLGDASFIPSYLVSKLTRGQVSVAMTGDGGDEIFGGYWRYREFQKLSGVFALPTAFRTCWSGLARAIATETGERGSGRWILYRLSRLAQFCTKHDFASAYQYALKTGLANQLLRTKCNTEATMIPASIQSRTLSEQMMWCDVTQVLPDDLLVKVDRASMSVGLECREPLLDYRLYELAARLPIAWKIGPAGGKLILRRILSRYLPAKLVNRRKQGFSVPLTSWLRSDLRNWVEERLIACEPTVDPLFNTEKIKRLWDQHQSGQYDHKTILWHLLVLRQWLTTQRWS